MVLLSCSGTGGRISAKLANEGARHNRPRAFSTHDSSVCDLARIVNKRIIAKAFVVQVGAMEPPTVSEEQALRNAGPHL
jgi:hypothetical protein